MKHLLSIPLLCLLARCSSGTKHYIDVPAIEGDATPVLQHYIDSAISLSGEKVIRLQAADYHLYRTSGTALLRHVSNTTTVDENPDPVKHFALWIKDAERLTLQGCGARFVTHGELSTFGIEDSRHIRLTDFSLTAADPSVPEMTVTEVGNDYLLARPHTSSHYRIDSTGTLFWQGEGWEFTRGIAQLYSPKTLTTWRCPSPLCEVRRVEALPDGLLRFHLTGRLEAKVGEVYQMRHSFRTEVCGFIHRSSQVRIDHARLHFLGNFGIVGQLSEGLTFDHLVCEPEEGSGRTCAGFADFIQISGCKGLVSITDSRFSGAHDDAINIHGTHLRITGYDVKNNQVEVRFMHGQSFGFQAFFPGDSIVWTDAHTLLSHHSARVVEVGMTSPYTFQLTVDGEIPADLITRPDMVLENITLTPEVEIRRNRFTLLPTRGILLTTRRPIVVEDNEFVRLPMSAILVSNDARSWYESGPVHNLLISRNRFIECASPVIAIHPENDCHEGPVHSGISIRDNRFLLSQPEDVCVSAHSIHGLTFTGNSAVLSSSPDQELSDCRLVTSE